MAEYLFEQLPVMKHGSDEPRLAFGINEQMFAPMPSLEEMAQHWGINTIDTRMLGAVKTVFHTGTDAQSLDDELIKLPPVPNGEDFTITRFIGSGVFFTGLAWQIECAKPNCTTFTIQVCKCSDGSVVHEVPDISASNGQVFAGDKLTSAQFIPSGEVFLLKLKFTQLPYIDDNGAMFWGNACNPVPCMGIRVHALIEDSCLAVPIEGCGLNSPCCNTVQDSPCNTPTLVKSC